MSDICKVCREPVELGRFGSGVGSGPKLVHVDTRQQISSAPYSHYAERATEAELAHKPLKNLKPSVLPVDTIIGVPKYDLNYEELYIHREYDGVTYWEDLFSGCGHCEDHEVISDIGRKNLEEHRRGNITTDKTSDEYFPDFKVIATPPGYVFVEEAASVHGNFSAKTMTYLDGTQAHNCKGFNCDDY